MNTAFQIFDTKSPAPYPTLITLDPPLAIKKTEILQYFRETKQDFLNLGSMLISLSDRTLYIFSRSGELNDVTTLDA